MPRKKVAEADTSSFGPGMKWSDEARARRSEAAKKAAATRKARQAAKIATIPVVNYNVPNSRVARWALSGVSMIAMMRGARYIRWGRPTLEMRMPFNPEMLRG